MDAARITLKSDAVVEGVGLFTAAAARVRLMAAARGTGVSFRRVDLPRDLAVQAIPALASHVVEESRRTVLAADPESARAAAAAGGPGAMARIATVQTVEHLLSALRGLGVTDVLIEVAGPEIPIGDGSAKFWVEAIEHAGCVSAAGASPPAHAGPIVVTEPIRVGDEGAAVEAMPLTAAELDAAQSGRGPATWYTYHLDYSNFPIAALVAAASKRIPAQQASWRAPMAADQQSRSEYQAEVAPARTFCLAEEAQAMRNAGLFTHLTPRDMLVVGDAGPIDNAWRFNHPANEPARHKLLDLIGDLSLCGRPVLGRIVATRSGHALNQAMARRLAGF